LDGDYRAVMAAGGNSIVSYMPAGDYTAPNAGFPIKFLTFPGMQGIEPPEAQVHVMGHADEDLLWLRREGDRILLRRATFGQSRRVQRIVYTLLYSRMTRWNMERTL
jgi:hypothetical protein